MSADITTLGLQASCITTNQTLLRNPMGLCGGGVCFGVRSPGNMTWTAAKLNWSQHQAEVLKTETKSKENKEEVFAFSTPTAAVPQVVSLKTNTVVSLQRRI